MSDMDLADAGLVEASLAGDREAFGLIVARYQSLICSLAFSATGSLTKSEDLAQETFVSAWKTLRDLREPARLRPWLCRIARNRICDVFRGEKREPTHAAETLDVVAEAAAPQPLPPDCAISREEEAILWRAIVQMPEIYREPLVLFYREHQSVQSVGQSLDLSEDAVKQRLSRGRKMLQEQVVAFVEGALEKTSPGKAFTVGVLAALPLTTTSAKAAALGSAIAKAGAGMKTAAAAGSAGGFFPPLMGALGLYHSLKSEIEDADSPRERQFITRIVWIRACFIVLYLAVLYSCMRILDTVRHPLAFEIMLAAFVFGVAIFAVTLFGYFDRRRRQIERESHSSTEPGKTGGFQSGPPHKTSKRNLYAAAAAGTAFPLAWLVCIAVGDFRKGFRGDALLALLMGGMIFFLAVRAWKRSPRQFTKFDFGKVMQIVALCGLITLVQYNLGHYLNGILAISSTSMVPIVSSPASAVAFNIVVVAIYTALIGTLVWKRKIGSRGVTT